MKAIATVVLLLGCAGCNRNYALMSARDLPVGHIVQATDILLGEPRPMWKLHKPWPPEIADDASKVVGHTVKHAIPANRYIDIHDLS